MTTYGTIATSPSPLLTNLNYMSRENQRPRSGIADLCPWKEMLNHHSIVPPSTLEEAIRRLKTNLDHSLTNYAIIMLFVLFLGLLWNPLSLLILTAMMAPWLFFYFLRDEPLVVFDRKINGRIALFVLSVFTIGILLLTDATIDVLISLSFGVVLVLVHAVLRKIDDLFLGEESVNYQIWF